MTIKKKLIAYPFLLLALFLVIGLFSWFSMSKTTVANLFDRETMYLQMMLRGVNEVIITEGAPGSVETAKKGLAGFDELHAALMADLTGAGGGTLSRQIDPLWGEIKKKITPFLQTSLDTEDDELMAAYGRVIADVDSLVEKVRSMALGTQESAEQAAAAARKIIVFAVAVIFAGTALVFLHLYRSIILPVNELSSLAGRFGEGDLGMRMDESREDEFGELASHFNRASERLGEFATQIAAAINTLASNASELETTAENLTRDAGEQAAQTEQSASAMDEMSQTIIDVARNAGDAANASGNASDAAASGHEVVLKTVEGMRGIADSVKETAETISGLGESSAEIGNILNVINEIADQTNLLALNAAIEAARAGEQGRGFAVVADEVRKLAERTGRSTQEIADMISGIQSDTEKSMSSMKRGRENVEQGVRLVEEASRSLESIVEVSRRGADMVQRIAGAAEEQSSATEQVSHGMESIAGAAQRTKSSAAEIQRTSENLAKLSHELSLMASWFKTA